MYHLSSKGYFGKYDCGIRRIRNHPFTIYQPEDKRFYMSMHPADCRDMDICWGCLKANGLLQIECAWCGRILGHKEGRCPEADRPVTHSICETCKEKVLKEVA